MGCYRTEEPLIGKEGIRPALHVIPAASSPWSLRAVTEHAPYPHSHPGILLAEDRLVAAVLEVAEPARKGPVHIGYRALQAAAGRPGSLLSDRVSELLDTLLPRPVDGQAGRDRRCSEAD